MLNALRHQRYVQINLGSDAKELPEVCSTPYGIKGMSSCDRLEAGESFQSCSTPYGIKGMSSELSQREPLGIKGAQRLTASKVCPVFGKIDASETIKCSTPYGIKGMSRLRTAEFQRNEISAQRLTASKVCPDNSSLFVAIILLCAQRLTASKVCPEN